jgi:hypothetical protein
MSAVKSIAEAISSGFQLLHAYKKDKHVRRLRASIDNAEKYIFENEQTEPNKKKLSRYKHRFFKYNQG